MISISTFIDLNSNETLKDGWKPIILAASVGNVDIIRELLNRGANVDDERGNIIYIFEEGFLNYLQIFR